MERARASFTSPYNCFGSPHDQNLISLEVTEKDNRLRVSSAGDHIRDMDEVGIIMWRVAVYGGHKEPPILF